MQYQEIIQKLRSMSNPEAIIGMARYGINTKKCLGISIYRLRELVKEIDSNHELALQLWDSGLHDARLLACFIDIPSEVTEKQMDAWAHDFDSWDICDQACTSLFDTSPFAWKKVVDWAEQKEEFVKRGAFSLLAGLAVHDKNADDKQFEQTFPLIQRHAVDERNYVKKAVNWALRNIGKRNKALNKKAIVLSRKISQINSSSARWIASDALRELTSEKVQERLARKK